MSVTSVPLAAPGVQPVSGSSLRTLVLLWPIHALLLVPIGAATMLLLSEFSRLAIRYASEDPFRTGGVGLLALAPVAAVALVLLLVSRVAFVLLVGTLGFFVLPVLIAAEAYAAVALGSAILSPLDRDGKWTNLVVGSVLPLVTWFLFPWGWLVGGVFLVLGVGAVARGTWTSLQRSA